jgi:5'-3' exonuclease
MNDTELVLIDLSSIAHPIWHMSQAEPDANATSQRIVARVRALAEGHQYAAVCCDSGRSFRKDVAPSYKANRPESDATLHHQITLAREVLAGDGFPMWAVASFEADDLIASAVVQTLATADLSALIVSADKDLLQLVGPRVRAMSTATGTVLDEAGVVEKFGVKPEQMRDYLCLVGDASDNIKGAKGIGPKTAADLLQKFGTLEGIYEAAKHGLDGIKPACVTALREFAPFLPVTRQLVTLRSDVPIPFAEIAAERVPKDTQAFIEEMGADDMDTTTEEVTTPADGAPQEPAATPVPPSVTALAPREVEVLGPASSEWQLQLDPRSIDAARMLAKDMHASRLFSSYGTPQGVLATIMLGRELGLPAMASLRQIHIIEGKQALSASLMVALILKSGMAEYFEPMEFDEKHATWETKRKGARTPVRLTHTIEMAIQAGLVKDKSGWLRNPIDMLNSRAPSRLARLVYPDVIGGLYTPDELHEIRDVQQQQVA